MIDERAFTDASPVPARMVCEISRGIHVTRPGEPPRYVPAGTKLFVDAWVGDGWYRGRLWDDPRQLDVHASDLGLPNGD